MKILLILLLPFQLFAQTSTLFKNVNIIDVKKGSVIANQNVLIEGNRIKKISTKTLQAKGSTIIDGTDKYLIPGLWDMHVHLFNNRDAAGTNNKEEYFPLLIANGVTGVRDLWTDADDIKLVHHWQKEVGAGKMAGPRIFVGSSIVDGLPVFHKNSLGVSSPDEARQVVRKLKNSGAGFIKVYDRLSRENYYAIADESKKLKIPFSGHVPGSVTVVEASNAGQQSIEHLTRMLIACSSRENKFTNLKDEEWTAALFLEMLQSFSEQKCREISEVFVKNGTWHDPTNVVIRSLYLSDDDSFKNDVRLGFVSDTTSLEWFKFAKTLKPASRSNRELRIKRNLEIVKIMNETGVRILAGTDLGNPFIYAGFSLHDELETLVKAKLTPAEALRTATINPAIFLNKQKDIGTIEAGKLADLVLLDANPLEEISNTRKINAVVANGRLLQRKDLDKLLEEAKKKAKRSN